MVLDATDCGTISNISKFSSRQSFPVLPPNISIQGKRDNCYKDALSLRRARCSFLGSNCCEKKPEWEEQRRDFQFTEQSGGGSQEDRVRPGGPGGPAGVRAGGAGGAGLLQPVVRPED